MEMYHRDMTMLLLEGGGGGFVGGSSSATSSTNNVGGAEERLIVQLHAKYGNKWARMAAQLPGRTDNEIKNYWNTRIKRRQRQGLPLYPPDIQPEHPQAQEQQLHSTKKGHTNNIHNSHSHHHTQHYHPYSQPSTPLPKIPTSTPPLPTTNTFSFHTQLLAPSPSPPPPTTTATTPPHTPPSVSQTPPLPPSHNYSTMPSQTPVFSTLPLFDPFSTPRNPPLLASSFRFRRHSLDTIANTGLEQPTTTHQITAPFSLPSSPNSGYAPPLQQQPDIVSSDALFRLPSFQFIAGQHSVLPETTHSVKLELPSNQLLSQNENSDLTFDTKVNISGGGGSSGLLDDLLEEAHALSNGETLNRLQEENRIFNGFDTHWQNNPTTSLASEAIKPKKEPARDHHQQQQHQMNGMHEDLSKIFNGIPTHSQPTTDQWYSDSGEFSNEQSSVITDENLGLEMQQHMASLFTGSNSTETGRIPTGSCSWDNMPGIC
ncbi:hypothetical protein ACFE04_024348 [Oxalis oulophora]